MPDTQPVPEQQSVLECAGLAVGYRNITVARDIDIESPAGTVLAVLGPNGAGKTTLLNTMAGFLKHRRGSVRVGTTTLHNGDPRHANRNGLVLVPDDRGLFVDLTVREHLKVARDDGSALIATLELFPALRDRLKVRAGDLSGGEQQMLAVARAVVQKPRVLLIDEMSMGLAPVIVEELLPVVRRIADDTGAVVVLVEQHVRLALEIADQALILVHGQVRLRGSAAELRANPQRLREVYLGSATAAEA
ncbi:ABC transporter ATP-binding protein [Nocardia sp. alder85J]|uniref:ABC transporter ATP-binding protein n=1 Tax=Nocardia sp. alder85J TaxID=2862949 RepID=UPI001CD62FDC|nr:ABC transporter ATP-binding protein [Nocardia sp. alder85J]MCX4095719.1 ABC transporter ATP-binding protein [Nocardia sp. alder85J]